MGSGQHLGLTCIFLPVGEVLPTSLPQPRQDNLRLLSAPLAKAEELVSCTVSFVEKLYAAGLQLPVVLKQDGIRPPQVLHDRCVHSIMGWQFPNESLELLWYQGEKGK